MSDSKRKQIGFAVVAVLSIYLALPTAILQAQSATWTNPISSFYEIPTNWTPNGLPDVTDVVVFNQTGDYDVGFQGNQAAEGLSVTNGANIDFVVAGADTTNRVFRINGEGVIDDARLRLLGNTSGPRISLVLTTDLNIRGATDALEVVDNAAILNRSTLVDLSGVVNVTGATASWNMSEDLTLRSDALLEVSSGGLASNLGDTVLGGSSSADMSNGFVSVSGVGTDEQPSTLITGNNMFIGSYGRGRLTVTDGAFVDVGNRARIAFGADSVGSVLVKGTDAVGNPSTWNSGALTVGLGGASAALDVEDGALVNSDGATVGDSSQGVVTVRGGDHPALWNIGGDLRVATGAFGQVNVRNGGTLETARTFLGLGTATSGLSLLSINGGELGAPAAVWENDGDVFVGGNSEDAFSAAVLEVTDNSQVEIGGKLKIWDMGTVSMSAGSTLSADIIEDTNGGFFIFEAGTLHTNRFEGDLVNELGTLAPGVGGPSGPTIIAGDYTQQSGATLSIDIGGTSPGGTHDFVNISGDGDLDGLLELSLVGGFVPSRADSFTVLAANSLIGFFDNVASGQRLDTIDGRGSFVVNYGIGSAFDERRIVLRDFQASASTPGDFDLDGDVDGQDFLAWQRNDGTPDGLADWRNNYGTTASIATANTAPVPEPTCAALIACVGVIAACRRAK